MRFLFLLFSIILLVGHSSSALGKSRISITNLEDRNLSTKMEHYVSIVVNEINKAFTEHSTPIFPSECITANAMANIYSIWKNSPFKFSIDHEKYSGIITSMGYQIRGLTVIMQEEKIQQNGVINFNPDGMIESFHFAIDDAAYNSLLKENNSAQDKNRRQFVLHFIEDFRTAYNRKDINLISRVYGEDVLIITGYVYQATADKSPISGLTEEKVQYNLYNKTEYLSRLKEVFNKNRFVNLYFEDISIIQHPSLHNIYGVTLLQKWRSTTYNDDGWLFMAIEFKNDTEMLIHVRTWQPYILNRLVVPREEVYQLGNFEFR